MTLATTDGSEWVVHYQLQGVAVGASEVTISIYDSITEELLWPDQVVTLADGDPYEFSMSFDSEGLVRYSRKRARYRPGSNCFLGFGSRY
jgi:hypothetical protein